MKILKIFGFVAGIHVFAFLFFIANPGCSSTSKPAPAPIDTVASGDTVGVSLPLNPANSSPSPAFDPNAPATAADGSGAGVRYFPPTRPGSAEASTLVTTPVSNVTPATSYTVKSGDSLWELGQRFHVPYAEIAAANNIRTSATLRAGQKLIIPSRAVTASNGPAASAAASAPAAKAAKAAPAPTAVKAAAGREGIRHTVKFGETLGAIAKSYGVKQGEIAVANNIVDPAKIQAGMILVIPGWQEVGGQADAKSAPRPVEADTPAPAPEPSAPASPPVFNLNDPAPTSSTPANEVPVMRIEDGAPAPKGN